jgi:hypothetical protein
MPHGNEPKFRREYTKDQLKGRHHLTLTPPELNETFLKECDRERRGPSDMIRIILEDRYASEVHYPKSVDAKPHGGERPSKREVA